MTPCHVVTPYLSVVEVNDAPDRSVTGSFENHYVALIQDVLDSRKQKIEAEKASKSVCARDTRFGQYRDADSELQTGYYLNQKMFLFRVLYYQ